MTTSAVSTARKISPIALPFLGAVAAIQGASPNISSTALIGASRGLDMTGSTQALAASTLTLAIAASVITTGLLADRFGRRNILVASLLLAAIGNVVIMTAVAPAFYITGQAITGIGLGATYAAAFAYIQVLAQPGKVASAMGTFAASAGLFAVIYTFVGGSLASSDWRLAFTVIPVLGVLASIGVIALLPSIPGVKGEKRNILGQFFLGLGLVSLLYGISHLASSLTDLQTWIPIVLGVALLAAFVISQAKVKNPFFPVSMFAKPVFIAAICAGFVYNFSNAVGFLQLTNLWQYIGGLKTSEVSMWQLPLLAAGILGALVFGRLMSRGLSSQMTILLGGIISAAGFVCAALARDSQDFVAWLPATILIGAGVIVASLPYGTLILSEAPKEFFGPVTSSRTTFGQLFYSVGIAVSTVFIDQLTRGGVVHRLLDAGVPADQAGTGLDAVNAYATAGTRPSTSLGHEALADAHASYVTSFGTMMLIAAGLSVVVAFIGFILITRANAKKAAATPAEAPTSA